MDNNNGLETKGKAREYTAGQIIKKYPRITAHIICESLGYATPLYAALVLKDAKEGKENWCEWIYSCYNRDPRKAVQDAIKHRHTHEGFMSDYKSALALVKHSIETGDEPLFASWF
jgi:hypothetical protein